MLPTSPTFQTPPTPQPKKSWNYQGNKGQMYNTLVSRIQAHGVKLQQIPAHTNLSHPSAAGLLRQKFKVFDEQLAKWLVRTVMVIVWWEKREQVGEWWEGDKRWLSSFSLFISLSPSLSPPLLSSWRKRGPAAEAVLATRLSPALVTASIAVTLTPPPLSLEHLWACHSPGSKGGTEASRGKSVLREICRGVERQWRTEAEPGMQRGKRRLRQKEKGKDKGGGGMGKNAKKERGREAVEWH